MQEDIAVARDGQRTGVPALPVGSKPKSVYMMS
jgi:hypothetical protein